MKKNDANTNNIDTGSKIASFKVKRNNKVIRNQESTTNKPVGKITKARRANKLTAEFLLAYVLPMIAFDYSTWKGIVLFLVYFYVLSFLCIGMGTFIILFLQFLSHPDSNVSLSFFGATIKSLRLAPIS